MDYVDGNLPYAAQPLMVYYDNNNAFGLSNHVSLFEILTYLCHVCVTFVRHQTRGQGFFLTFYLGIQIYIV